MNQKARALLRKITFLFILLGFIDYVVAYGLPHWAKYTTTAGQIHRYGLFMTCIQDFIKSECDTFHLANIDGKVDLCNSSPSSGNVTPKKRCEVCVQKWHQVGLKFTFRNFYFLCFSMEFDILFSDLKITCTCSLPPPPLLLLQMCLFL